MSSSEKPPTYVLSSMYLGDGPTMMSFEKRAGSSMAASAPIIELTECPTNMTSRRSSSRQHLEYVSGIRVRAMSIALRRKP